MGQTAKTSTQVARSSESPAKGKAVKAAEVFGAGRAGYASSPYLEQKSRVQKLYGELKSLELEHHIAELSMYGYTVVPREKLMPISYLDELYEAVLKIAEERSGIKPDTARGTTHAMKEYPQFMRYVLFDDPVFEPMITNPVLQGLARYLAGCDCLLSLNDAMVKGPGEMSLPIHNDNRDKTTAVFPDQAQAATINVFLSDYDEGSGPIAFLPGSHTFRREPTPAEMQSLVTEMEPVHATAGSAVVWHVNTWHMALPRTKPGLRVTLLYHYCRSHLQTQSSFRDQVPQESLDRNPPRFAQLLHVHGILPIGKEGVDRAKVEKASMWHSLFDCHPIWKSFYDLG